MPCFYYEKKRATGIYTRCDKRHCNELNIQDQTVCSKHFMILDNQLKKHGKCDFNYDKFIEQQKKLGAPIPPERSHLSQPIPKPQPPPQQPQPQQPQPQQPQPQAIPQTQQQQPIKSIPTLDIKYDDSKEKEELKGRYIAAIKRCAAKPTTPRDSKGAPLNGNKKRIKKESKKKKAKKVVVEEEQDIPFSMEDYLDPENEVEGISDNENLEDEAHEEPVELQSNLRKVISQSKILFLGFVALSDAVEKTALKYDVDIGGTTMVMRQSTEAQDLLEEFMYDIMPELKEGEMSAGTKLALLWSIMAGSQYAFNLDKQKVRKPVIIVDSEGTASFEEQQQQEQPRDYRPVFTE